MPNTENNNLEPRTSNLENAPQPKLFFQNLKLIDVLLVIAKRSRMIFFVTLIAAVLSIVYSLFLPNIYTAKTLILPSQDDKGMVTALTAQLGGMASLAGGTGISFGSPTLADLYVSILKSESLQDPIIDRFKLMQVFKKKYRADTYKVLERNTLISTSKKDGIVIISVDNKDPKLAADIANSYVEELGNLTARLNITGAGKNRAFLEERLARARADLAGAEENLKDFQAKNKAVQMTAQAEATIKGVAEMKAKLAAQEVQLAMYRRQFTESSQEVKNIAVSISNLRAQIANLEGGGGNSSIPSVGSIPSLEQEYIRLKREFKIQESLVEVLTKQYEIARLSEARDVSPIQVIQRAKVPERKSRPSRSLIVMMAIFAAFFISVISAFVLEHHATMSEEERANWRGLFPALSLFRKRNVD